jgi:hypothetical protein
MISERAFASHQCAALIEYRTYGTVTGTATATP